MEKIFGNTELLNTFDSMLKSGRVPHSFLLYGENGLGKKTFAATMAAKLAETTHPFTHPDIIWVEHSGKTKGFSVSDLRKICADAYIIPNTSERKVYILSDCDNISAAAQDTLLKIVEEPPRYVYFIFTASDKSVFLPTILSRVISFGMCECTIEECREALSQNNFSSEDIEKAISVFGGNIGLCKNFIEGDELKIAAKVVREITECIISKNEYNLLKSLNAIDSDRSLAKNVLSMLDKVIRDCSVTRLSDVKMLSCYTDGAERLSQAISLKKANICHEIIQKTLSELDTNVNLSIELSALCAQLINI